MTSSLSYAYNEIKQKNLLLKQEMIDQKKLEQALRQKSIAENANQAKSMFLATMSHEIRSPMTGIQITTDLLGKTDLNRQQKAYLETLSYSHSTLLTIINDILDINKIESGQLTLDRVVFNVTDLLTELLTLLKAQSENKKIPLILAIDPEIHPLLIGDPLRLRQILLNLISNAIKFTSRGKISVFLNRLKSHNGIESLEFQVQDSGIGIPAKALPIIFEPFIQVDTSLTRRFKGTGLGLSICKKLVTIMDGEIKVTSLEGEGSLFQVMLEFPTAKESLQQKTIISPPKPDSRPSKSLLLVDDNPVNQTLIAEFLTYEGYQITTADDGYQALETLEAHVFDAILMDIRMPGIDGFETTRRIRKMDNKKAAATQIIAFSAEIAEDTATLCQEVGMDDIISKPINLEQLDGVLTKNTI